MFNKKISKFNKKTEKAIESIVKGTFLSLASKIIVRTPVDTGRARGNWQTSINSKPSGEVNDSESEAINKASRVKFKIGDSLYLINNLPYIQALEDGHSKQTPVGMVKITVAEYQEVVNQEVRKRK